MELTFLSTLEVTLLTLCYFGKELNTVDFIHETRHFWNVHTNHQAKSVDTIQSLCYCWYSFLHSIWSLALP